MKSTVRTLSMSCALVLFAASALAETTYVKAGKLLNPVNGRVAENAVIVIESDRVTAVDTGGLEIPADATVVDLSNHFVLPGVMDMHTHIVANLDKFYFAGYFQSPHRAVIGGVQLC